jgi:hypothetical protein
MPVFAWFIFTDSFSTFFLPVVLDLAVVAIFSIPACVASCSRVEMIAALRCPGVLPLCSVLELVVPSVLESCDYVLFILGLQVAILINSCHGSRGFGS